MRYSLPALNSSDSCNVFPRKAASSAVRSKTVPIPNAFSEWCALYDRIASHRPS